MLGDICEAAALDTVLYDTIYQVSFVNLLISHPSMTCSLRVCSGHPCF